MYEGTSEKVRQVTTAAKVNNARRRPSTVSGRDQALCDEARGRAQ